MTRAVAPQAKLFPAVLVGSLVALGACGESSNNLGGDTSGNGPVSEGGGVSVGGSGPVGGTGDTDTGGTSGGGIPGAGEAGGVTGSMPGGGTSDGGDGGGAGGSVGGAGGAAGASGGTAGATGFNCLNGAVGGGVVTPQAELEFPPGVDKGAMIQRGVQAILMCNGLFTSNRTLEQVFRDELAYVRSPIGTASGGDYEVDQEQKTVTIGVANGNPAMRAAFRKGLGCVILHPDQTFADLDSLPILDHPPPPGDPATIPWPDGDMVDTTAPLPSDVDAQLLQAASDWAFDRPSQQVTLSLLIVKGGQIIHERYAPGVDVTTRTRTWSTAKSIASTLIGMLVDRELLDLDEPLDEEWLPPAMPPATDPRAEITLRHVLHMSSGLETVDNGGQEYVTGSGLAYWAGASSVVGMRNRGFVRKPGTHFDYENYDNLLAVHAMKKQVASPAAYLGYPRCALLDPIGMRNTLLSVDRFGDFILSSQVYTNARDLARFGLLYVQEGMWGGRRLLSKEWVDFVRTPSPATAAYGGQFWLVPGSRGDLPKGAYSTNGNRGQYVVIDPSNDLVIVRRGLDYGNQGFSQWNLLGEVLKAIR